MLWSTLFIPTLREVPAEAEVISHQLLLRAGYIRQLSAGIYNYLLLARRSLLKIEQIVREEMNAIGGQEMLLAALHPAELWQESGRWQVMGDNMFRLKDRFGRDLCLGMTHEEIVTSIARGELRSYKQLPQIWYQIQTKFRDEPRPKSGLLRVRQFIMKDSYTFDLDAKGLDIAYDKHHAAYCKIFDRCGLEYIDVEAHSGAMGGSESHEFMIASDAGEDFVVRCQNCGYRANLEKAVSRASEPLAADLDGNFEPEQFHTPDQKTIADLAQFTNLPETSQMKSLAMVVDKKPVLIMMRGDHQLSETKLAAVLHATELRPAHPQEIVEWFGASAGSLGPVGVNNMRVLADDALKGRRNLITGANRDDYHLRNVTPGEDFRPEYFDLRQAASGDACPNCGSPLEIVKAIEIGHIFKLGYKYAESMGLRVLGEDGKEITPIMGSYGIGIERILTCAIELYHDPDGMALPASIAPFSVVITPVNYREPLQREAADLLYAECTRAGIDALLDDRDERPGVKFKDADLIGIPYRVTIGKKLNEGKVEFGERRTRASEEVLLHGALAHLQKRLGLPVT
ncbi:MAG: proline--tRNA ligase [Acidobacteriaceae bacterium]|nr:proline--tRNA ligase [Acidobacteriaceae bacterium]MBV9779168.1 proline--tRNA ligase [Acidobacteriaceae bacterium]